MCWCVYVFIVSHKACAGGNSHNWYIAVGGLMAQLIVPTVQHTHSQ